MKNNKENPHSQSSQLDEEDLQKFEADSMPVNTKKPCVHVVAPWLVAKCMQVLRLQGKRTPFNKLCQTVNLSLKPWSNGP